PAGPSGPVGEYPAETVISFAAAPVAIDGVVETGENGSLTGDWQGAFAENIAGLVDANGDEHGADVYLKYDYDNLYVGAKIKDPTPMRNTNTGSNIWNGDNMEIFLGTDDLDYALYPDKKQTTIPSDVQIVLSGGIDDGPQFYLYQNGVFTYPNITMGVHQDADGKGYTIEAAIPLSVLGIANSWDSKKVIMNPVLNDGGYDKRGQWGWTTNDEASKKSRGQWGLAALEPADAPQVEISANASVEINTNVVTVAGQTANVQSRDVTILVTDANENIAYIDQTLSDAQGNYSFTFPVNSDAFGAGIYTATVGGEGIVRTNAAAFTLAADTAAPAEVTNIGVSAGNGKLTLTWSDPANADYDYALVRVLGQTSAPVMVGKGVQQVEIGSLTNGTEYTAAIQTVDLSGNISQGMEAKGTPVIPSTPTADTAAPAEVTNTEVSAGSGMLTLTWTDPADADYDHAVVRVQGQSAAPVIVTKGEQRIEIGSLANGTEYTVAIQTVDLTGNISPGIEVKGTPVSPSTPSTSSGNASTAPETDKDTVIVDLKDKKPDQNGQVTVELPKDAAVLQIAVDQISIVGSGGLLVKAGNAEIAIPAEVLADAAKLGDGNGAYIAIHVDQHANGDQTDAADKMSSDNLKVKLFGDGFKLQVSLVNKDGVSKELTRFSKTVSIAMPAAGGEADPELLGVYFYNEQTKQLEYIGGHIDENGLLTFDLVKPGVYQVVEYDKLFLDVPSGHWANRAVKVLSARHIVNGMTENAFKPNQQITRADFAVLLANVLGLKPEQQTSFTDVDPGSYYAGAVAALFEAKLISGRGDNQFDPTATITREEMILLIVHAFEFKTGTALDTGSESFADSSSISVWAQDAVSAAKQAGLINGRGSNEFDPKAGSARSDTAQLIYNFLKQMER
ncbi:S-layer homology domain-containing protein, partial [Paenibacillus sepulcri]|nr:S-layer homology domain-containing protein [Paenibacillus sepulcri]